MLSKGSRFEERSNFEMSITIKRRNPILKTTAAVAERVRIELRLFYVTVDFAAHLGYFNSLQHFREHGPL